MSCKAESCFAPFFFDAVVAPIKFHTYYIHLKKNNHRKYSKDMTALIDAVLFKLTLTLQKPLKTLGKQCFPMPGHTVATNRIQTDKLAPR